MVNHQKLKQAINTGLLAIALTGCSSLETKIASLSTRSIKDGSIEETGKTGKYLKLWINEKKENGKVRLYLEEIFETKTDVGHLVKKDYINNRMNSLEIHDKNDKVIGRYELWSSRFIIVEDFSGSKPKGQIIEKEEGAIQCFIPYLEGANSIVMYNNQGNKTRISLDNIEIKKE